MNSGVPSDTNHSRSLWNLESKSKWTQGAKKPKQNKTRKKMTQNHHSSNKICIMLTWYFRDCLKQDKTNEKSSNKLARPSRKLGPVPSSSYVTVGINFNLNLWQFLIKICYMKGTKDQGRKWTVETLTVSYSFSSLFSSRQKQVVYFSTIPFEYVGIKGEETVEWVGACLHKVTPTATPYNW